MVVLFPAVSAATTDPQAAQYVWWEAEDFAATNLPHPQQPYPADITPEERRGSIRPAHPPMNHIS
jgi:hypothetical protein